MLPAALCLLTAALPADSLREQIIATASQLPPSRLSFERVVTLERSGGGTRSRVKRTERWDGQRWSLVSYNGKQPSAAERVNAERTATANGVPGYHQLAMIMAAASSRRVDAQGRVILSIDRMPDGTVNADGADISSHLKAEATLGLKDGSPFVERLVISEREGFKLNWLIKVTSFQQVNDYLPDSGGKPRLIAQDNSSVGSMFGISGGETSKIVYAYP